MASREQRYTIAAQIQERFMKLCLRADGLRA
jgi:hypothetical protein